MKRKIYVFLMLPNSTAAEIRRLEIKRDAIRESLLLHGIRYDRDKVQTSASDQMAEIEAEISDIEDKIRELTLKKIEQIRNVDEAVESLEDDREKIAISLRFIAGKKIDDVAEEMNYSREQVYRFIRRGVKNMTQNDTIIRVMI